MRENISGLLHPSNSKEQSIVVFVFILIFSFLIIFASYPNKVYAATNLLTNPGAETGDFTGWTRVNGGSGWAIEGFGHSGSHSFISSYAWGTLSQEIDLVAAGYTTGYLDSVPTIDSSVWVVGNGDFYKYKVVLRDASHSTISTYDTGTQNSTGSWQQLSTSFNSYGTGLRYIYFEIQGKDTEYWAGYYGSIFDDASVTVAEVQHSVEYSAGAGGSLTGTTSQTVTDGEDGNAVTAVPASGYVFSKWSDDVTDNPRTDTAVSGDISVTAEFSVQHALSYTAGTGGSITGTTSQTVTDGADGTAVTAVPASGYAFVKWSDDVTDNPRTDTAVDGNISVSAVFSTDPDNDGVPNSIELGAPNGGDGNDDGTTDDLQANVTSFVSTVTGKYVTLVSGESCPITSIGDASVTEDNYIYKLGMVNFALTCDEAGATSAIQLFFHSRTNQDYLLRKYDSETKVSSQIDEYTLNATTIGGYAVIVAGYSVTDGGAYDQDGIENSTIVDPVGLAVAQPVSTSASILSDTGQSIYPIIGLVLGLNLLGISIFIYQKR